MDVKAAMEVAASGMKAQGERMRIISQNIANANSTADSPDDLPYRRKVMTFKNVMDEQTGVQKVRVGEIKPDKSDFTREYQPGHPAANDQGYVLKPNVNTVVELNDMRQARRSMTANMQVIRNSKQIMMSTLKLLR